MFVYRQTEPIDRFDGLTPPLTRPVTLVPGTHRDPAVSTGNRSMIPTSPLAPG